MARERGVLFKGGNILQRAAELEAPRSDSTNTELFEIFKSTQCVFRCFAARTAMANNTHKCPTLRTEKLF